MTTTTKNLLECYALATPTDKKIGRAWYSDARAFCEIVAAEYGLPWRRVAGVVAALSPQVDWPTNKISARALVGAWRRNVAAPRINAPADAIRKATAILNGERAGAVLGGKKVRRFYANILGRWLVVTVDRHAKCCAQGWRSTENALVKPHEYNPLADAFRAAAKIVGERPAIFQAVVWVTWKRINGQKNQLDLFKY